jgi:hypothetical protein
MDYRSVIEHPEFGRMLNLTESAKYLGISRRKFRRVAPAPDYVQSRIYPFWAKRVLDILPIHDDFDHEESLRKGRACGQYLISEMDADETWRFRNALAAAKNGGIIREHTCGVDDLPAGADLLERAKWLMRHCNCHGTPPIEEIPIVLTEHGVTISFGSEREAQAFCDGVLSAIRAAGFVRC